MNLTRIAANAILMMVCLVLQAGCDQVHVANDVEGKVNALGPSFTSGAVAVRGVGGSTLATDGYDAANLALDVEQLIGKLQLEHAYLVGHDIGGLVI